MIAEDPPALTLRYSPCPNDTFMFDALVHGRLPEAQTGPLTVELADIEALNQACLHGLDGGFPALSKVSAGALPWLTRRYTVLNSGAALGHGCGPLVVVPASSPLRELDQLDHKRVAIPGERTTAYLLLRIFAPRTLQPVPMVFSEILPAVARGEVDAGLIIHESRFTYAAHGLRALADLGELWESETGLPLPLGVVVGDRALGERTLTTLERALSASVRHAFAHPADSRDYVRAHAQEMSEEVCQQHIALYVNARSQEMGAEGRAAIDALLQRGVAAGALPPDAPSPWR